MQINSIDIGIGSFGVKDFYVGTVGRNKKTIQEYIHNQLQEDIVTEQIIIAEYFDSFIGEETKEQPKKKKPRTL